MGIARGIVRGTVRGVVRGVVRGTRSLLDSESLEYWLPNLASSDGQTMYAQIGNGNDFQNGSTAGTDANDAQYFKYDSADGGYAWFPGSAGNSITVTNPAAGTAEIVVDYADGTSQLTYTDASATLTFGDTDVNFADKKVHRITINDGVSGPEVGVFDADGATQKDGYADVYANVFAVNTSTTGAFTAIINGNTGSAHQGDGISQYLERAADGMFAIGDGEEKTTILRALLPDDVTSFGRLVATNGGSGGLQIQTRGTASQYYGLARDTLNTIDQQGPVVNLANQISLVSLRFTNTQLIIAAGGASVTLTRTVASIPDQIARIFSSGEATPGNYQRALFFGLAVFDRALSNAEITQVGNEMLNRNK